MARPSQRDRVLDAYTAHVVTSGPEAVTLEAVARGAGVSKGGLLYHFPSKDALLGGLLDRARALNDGDVVRARESPEGIARYYLRTSVDDPAAGSELYRLMIALYKLSTTEPRAAATTRECMATWQTALTEELGDPLTAQLVAVVGDGIYLRAVVGETSEALGRDWEALLARLGP